MVSDQSTPIVTALRGQSIILPDLNSIFHSWPKETNQNLEQLRRDVNEWLNRTMSHSSKLESLKAADFGYFGATWWPRARYERLKIVTFLIVWLFVWDDEIDGDNCSLSDDVELSDPYRMETRDFIQNSLGLSRPTLDYAKPVNATVRAFETVGIAMRKAYNYEQRQRFMDHMGHYLDMARREQMLRLQGTLPSLEEFWSYRLGTSAMHALIAVNEFALENKPLPSLAMVNDHMKLLWDYTNRVVATVNDICSLRKEIARESIYSMIPILYTKSKDLQQAVDETAEFLVLNVMQFKETAQRLLRFAEEHNIIETPKLADFVRGCQFYCTGNLAWSLVTRRYGICEEDLSSKSRITLSTTEDAHPAT